MVIAIKSPQFARLSVRSPTLRAAILPNTREYLEETACD
jgi:hypothetical protein